MEFRLSQRRVDLRAAVVVADGGERWALSPTEVRLLQYLARTPGEIVPREELLREVWGYAAAVRTRTIDTTCARLRGKLEAPDGPAHLVTVYGLGVRLDGITRERPAAPLGGPLHGRDAELVELHRSIDTCRWVTVLGPGGVGKSRLVGEVLPRLARPVVQVSGACSGEPRELDRRVRAALGVGEAIAVGAALRREGPLVLVIDECEGSVAAVAERVAGWLAEAPELRVVATSRTPLGSPAEQRFPLGPLEESAAVALFVDRARARDPATSIHPDDVRAWVALIDRLPLAIELAAGRLSVLGADALGPLLRSPLAVLGSAGGPSMAQQLERSFHLLPVRDRALLAHLAVFESSFDLTAAAAVADLAPSAAMDGLEVLVDRSLVRRQGDGRLQLYAVVRERARQDSGLAPGAGLAHARWFAGLCDPATLDRARGDRALSTALREASADLWAAVDASEPTEPSVAAACLTGLVWLARGGGAPAEALLARLMGIDRAAVALPQRLALLRSWASLRLDAADLEGARALAVEALGLSTDPADRWQATDLISNSHRRAGERDRALELLVAVEADATAAGHRARWLASCGVAHPRPDAALELFVEAARLGRRAGDPVVEIGTLGLITRRKYAYEADWVVGLEHLERALASARGLGWVRAEANLCAHLATHLWLRGDLDRAEGVMEDGRELYVRTGDRSGASTARCLLARIWTLQGRPDDAVGLASPESDEERFPSYEAAFAWLTLAEAHTHAGRARAARSAVEEGTRHAVAGGYAEIEAELHELRAVLERDEVWLERAAARDPRGRYGEARRAAIRAIVAAARGDPAAEAARAEAERRCDALELLPGSDPRQWLAREVDRR